MAWLKDLWKGRSGSCLLYRTDRFFGLVWRWEWQATGGPDEMEPCGVRPYCPECNMGMTETSRCQGDAESNLKSQPRTKAWSCPMCNRNFHFTPALAAKDAVLMKVREGNWTTY